RRGYERSRGEAPLAKKRIIGRLRYCVQHAVLGIQKAKEDTMSARTLTELQTPCLVLDEARMERNIERLRVHARNLGVTLRPHLKTSKSVEVARRTLEGGNGPATVSTLKEAEVFFEAGVTDILYAVGLAP